MSEKKRKKEETAKPGMREALKQALEAIDLMTMVCGNMKISFADAVRLTRVRMSIKYALENPRNCDRYEDYRTSIEAWEKACGPNLDMMDGYDFAVWLFKKSEGGSK